MKLINMRRPKRSKKEMMAELPDAPIQEQYPWGLRLSFDADEVEKIPALQKITAGARVEVRGIGVVTDVSLHDSTETRKKSRRVEIQIHKVNVAGRDDAKGGFEEYERKK